MRARTPRPYADPYRAGVGLGLVLLAAFVLVGRGLGASGAFAAAAATAVAAIAPGTAAGNAYFSRYLGDWPAVDRLARGRTRGRLRRRRIVCGLAGRLRLDVERGPRMSGGLRLAAGFAGGAAMGVGAVLARGCTSGQALTGGALLSAGSWIFMVAAFAAAYAVAPLVRRAWL